MGKRNMKSSLALIQVLILCNLHNSNAISDQVGSGDPLASPWRWAWYLGQDFKDNLVSCPEQCGKGGLCFKKLGREFCETCGEGTKLLESRRCRKLEPCDEKCGAGAKCYT